MLFYEVPIGARFFRRGRMYVKAMEEGVLDVRTGNRHVMEIHYGGCFVPQDGWLLAERKE